MAAIDKQEFIIRCKAVNPLFTESVFPGLFVKIGSYNAAVQKAVTPPTATTKTTFVTAFQIFNKQYAESMLKPTRKEPNLYDKVLQQASSLKAAQAGIELEGALRSLSPEVRGVYAGPLAYVQSCIRGKMAKPDESQIFKMSLTISSREAPLDLRAEGFPSLAALDEVAANLKIICPLIHELAGSDTVGPRRNWFARESLAEVQSALVNLDMYLNHKCQRLTFKVLKTGKRCDNSEVEEILAGQVIPTVMLEGEDRPDFRKENGYLQVPAGLRIFFGPLYFAAGADDFDEILRTVAIYRFMTLFHEMTHKIIKTTDQEYELLNCRKIKDTPQAVMCADSWGYFLTDYAAETNRLPGGGKSSKFDALKARFGG